MQEQKLWMPALAAALTLTAGAAGAQDARHEIQGDYRRFTAAETGRQYDRIKRVTDSFFSPNFTLKLPKKTITYAQFLGDMKDTAHETLSVRENAFHPQVLKRQGDTLTETGVYVFSRTATDPDGEFGAKGLAHRMKDRMTYRSTWARAGGGWRLQSLQMLGRRRLVDGKLKS